MDMLGRGSWLPHEVRSIERTISDRRSQVEAGLQSSTAHHWTEKLRRYDPQLRLRWDFDAPNHKGQGWVIERAVPEWRCWAVCGVLGFHYVPINLLAILAAGDMQRIGPKRYLEQKRAAAQRVRDENDRLSTERVAAAVDSLSEKRIKEFIQVEKAVQTGETIVAHGETEKSLDRMRQASFQAQQSPETSDLHDESQAINPDDHPLRRRHHASK